MTNRRPLCRYGCDDGYCRQHEGPCPLEQTPHSRTANTLAWVLAVLTVATVIGGVIS